MTVRCSYCHTEHEADDPADIDVLVYWDGATALVFCDAQCWMAEVLFRDDEAA